MTTKHLFPVLTLALTEGAMVVTVQLAGSMFLAPSYGTSVAAWGSIIGTTLLFLSIGYWLGSKFSSEVLLKTILLYVSMMVAGLLVTMPILAGYTGHWFHSVPFFWAMFLSTLVTIGPPMLLLGVISPCVVQLVSAHMKGAGQAAGMVFGISTLGGVLVAFLLGMILIPAFGLRIPLVVGAMIFFIVGLGLFATKEEWLGVTLFTLLVSYIGFSATKFSYSTGNVLYSSEGVYGQVQVVDHVSTLDSIEYRRLLLNGIAQTFVYRDKPRESIWAYVHAITVFATMKEAGSRAVLFGMGGGSLVHNLRQMGIDPEVVDIDPRMFALGERYFQSNVNNRSLNDGRQFIRNIEGNYDLMVFDVLSGETQPSHMFTLESFMEMKQKLHEKGMVLINYQGYVKGPKSILFKSIYKTMHAAGLKVYHWYHSPDALSDIVLVASPSTIDFSALDVSRLPEHVVNDSIIDMDRLLHAEYREGVTEGMHGIILRDHRSRLDLMNTMIVKEWRDDLRP